jgi:hypothetical protein
MLEVLRISPNPFQNGARIRFAAHKFHNLQIFPPPICENTSSGFFSPGKLKIGEEKVLTASINRHMYPPVEPV